MLLTQKNINLLQLGLLTVMALSLFIGCGKKESATTETNKNTDQVIPVEVTAVQREDLSVLKTYTGPLEGVEQASIVPKISERIESVKTHIGSSVKKGDVLVILDKGGPTSQFLQSEANYLNTDKTLTRMKALFKEGAISQQSLDGVQTSFDIAKANYEAAKQNVELVAPISGIVTALPAEVGSLSSPGVALATVAQIDRIKVIFNMNEEDVVDIAVGQTVQINSEYRTEAPVDGKVTEVFHSADAQSRTFEVRALFTNTADRWFKPGMFVKVKYQSKPQTKAMVIPNQAILNDGSVSKVFVIKNGRSFQKTISLGNTDGIKTVVRDGLTDTDTVVITGWNNLRDSISVNETVASK